MIIRKAISSEHNTLTEITVKSKMYWGYNKEYYEIWKDDLIVTSDYIEKV